MWRTASAVVAASAVAFAALGVAGAPAHAAGATASDLDVNGLVEQFTTLDTVWRVNLDPRTGQVAADPTALGDAVGKVVDAATGKLLRTTRLDMVAQDPGPAESAKTCVKNGGGKNLTIYPKQDRYLSGKAGVVHFQYHPYAVANARKVLGEETTQYEVCSLGGGDLQDGWRLFQAGTGMAIEDRYRFLKIGQAWRTGSTPKDYSLELGFEVAPKNSPVSINGSITQNPSDKLMGSIVDPYKTEMNDYTRNAVNAWWQDSCVNKWTGCHKWDGSPNFQGALAQGLWEYRNREMPLRIQFLFRPYVKWACTGVVKCG